MVYPLLVSKNNNGREIDLLYFKKHYCWIKDLSRLLSGHHSKHVGKKYICRYCLHFYEKQDSLEEHKPDCMALNGVQKTILPKGEAKIRKSPPEIKAAIRRLLISSAGQKW